MEINSNVKHVKHFVDKDNSKELEDVRRLIYKNKDTNHLVILKKASEEDVDMFMMDYLHAPVTNVECLTHDKYLHLTMLTHDQHY